MTMQLRFGASPHGPGNDRGLGTSDWHASDRWRRAIWRNIDAGVLAIMLAGCALTATHLLVAAAEVVQASAGAHRITAASAREPQVAAASEPCIMEPGARLPGVVVL